MIFLFRLARHDPASNESELACDGPTLNGLNCEMPVECSSHFSTQGMAVAPDVLFHEEAPPTYAEAIAAP